MLLFQIMILILSVLLFATGIILAGRSAWVTKDPEEIFTRWVIGLMLSGLATGLAYTLPW